MILAGVAVASSAHATLYLDGGLAVGGSGSYTSSSLTLNGFGLVESASGDFNPNVQSGSGATLYSQTIGSLSATAKTENISDFFTFSSTLLAPGTTPSDQYVFDLATLKEVAGVFYGTGTVVDTVTSDGYAPTAADFTLSLAGNPGQSGLGASFSMSTIAPVPEPSTIFAGASLLVPFSVGAIRMLRRGRTT